MTESNDQDRKKNVLSLSGRGKLESKKTGDGSQQVRQSFSHGRSKTVTVEVKRKRTADRTIDHGTADGGAAARRAAEGSTGTRDRGGASRGGRSGSSVRQLTESEREARVRALRGALKEADQAADLAQTTLERPTETIPEVLTEPEAPLDAETLRQREMDELKRIQDEERRAQEEAEAKRKEEEDRKRETEAANQPAEQAAEADAGSGSTQTPSPAEMPSGEQASPAARPGRRTSDDSSESDEERNRRGRGAPKAPAKTPKAKPGDRRRGGKMTVTQALNSDDDVRSPSLAAQRRARQKERQRQAEARETQRITREVVVPETITVQELANRMSERGGEVIKTLMRLGVMATINQSIDADTAELVVSEFGHRIQRVSDADVEIGLEDTGEDTGDILVARPPVVTIMGHVDHGKTSLLDAIRSADVAEHEAGGITQHIGAYQVKLESGNRLTFIDTPGHAAFTEMRARGADVTDVVVLVVAADDSIMPQTAEAIAHAKAAGKPIIVAINKCDLPDANPDRVRQDLLQHEMVVEEMGGDVLSVEVSAKSRTGLDKLEEAILLQSELLELRANPNRTARGVVIEARLERGRGSVGTILVQQGTLRVGDVFIAGAEWGRVRALINDRGKTIEQAEPGDPVEVLGLQGTPDSGDDFIVVENEARAREISEFRQRKHREAVATQLSRGSVEQMFSRIQAGEQKELAVVIKGDAHGSIEAIESALKKITQDNEEVAVRVLHRGVGAISESDITLAKASDALMIGFNVRANPQAREMAKRDGIDIRYYSIIYEVIDDVKSMLTGMLAPQLRERFLGYADIRQVFNITRVGKVAGCMVTDGIVKRGAGVRLLRDNVVIHEGRLKTLKRFKDEVKEVREGYECGMAFENYDNIQEGDVIEAYEVEEIAREL